jgi:hypothetical protein
MELIYLNNPEYREALLSSSLVLRNKSVTLYKRNPRYLYKETNDTTKCGWKIYLYSQKMDKLLKP